MSVSLLPAVPAVRAGGAVSSVCAVCERYSAVPAVRSLRAVPAVPAVHSNAGVCADLRAGSGVRPGAELSANGSLPPPLNWPLGRFQSEIRNSVNPNFCYFVFTGLRILSFDSTAFHAMVEDDSHGA